MAVGDAKPKSLLISCPACFVSNSRTEYLEVCRPLTFPPPFLFDIPIFQPYCALCIRGRPGTPDPVGSAFGGHFFRKGCRLLMKRSQFRSRQRADEHLGKQRVLKSHFLKNIYILRSLHTLRHFKFIERIGEQRRFNEFNVLLWNVRHFMENFVLIKKKTGQLSKGGVCMRVMSKSSPVAVSSLQPPPLINSALLEIKQHLPPITFFKTRFSNQFSFISVYRKIYSAETKYWLPFPLHVSIFSSVYMTPD